MAKDKRELTPVDLLNIFKAGVASANEIDSENELMQKFDVALVAYVGNIKQPYAIVRHWYEKETTEKKKAT